MGFWGRHSWGEQGHDSHEMPKNERRPLSSSQRVCQQGVHKRGHNKRNNYSKVPVRKENSVAGHLIDAQ